MSPIPGCYCPSDSDQTFQTYSAFITKYDNVNYESEMVAVNELYSPARQQKQDREMYESQLVGCHSFTSALRCKLIHTYIV